MKRNTLLLLLLAVAFCASAQNQPSQDTAALKCQGLFSVSPTQQVRFSEGNLQYQPSTGLWRFAPEQTDIVGWNARYTDSYYKGYIDLFGWGTGMRPAQYSGNADDYTYTDWGTTCALPTGDGKLWRALTMEEWQYLLNKRPKARRLFGLAYIEGKFGLVLLPDDWKRPAGTWVQTGVPDTLKNYWSMRTWKRIEASGAVFLPSECRRMETRNDGGSAGCHYWTATPSNKKKDNASYMTVDIYGPRGREAVKAQGFSVRLVQEP